MAKANCLTLPKSPTWTKMTSLCLDVLVAPTKRKKFRIKETNGHQLAELSIKKNKLDGDHSVDFEEDHADDYEIDVYDETGGMEPLSNVLKLRKFAPNQDDDYKPEPIDISTMRKQLDSETDTVFLYWSVPETTFGDISYKVVRDDQEAKDEDVEVLPYSLPLATLPAHIQIVTVCTIDGRQSLSEPSAMIQVGQREKPVMNPTDDANDIDEPSPNAASPDLQARAPADMKWDPMPAFFIQVTSVAEDEFSVRLLSATTDAKKQKFDILEIGGDANATIDIKKKQVRM